MTTKIQSSRHTPIYDPYEKRNKRHAHNQARGGIALAMCNVRRVEDMESATSTAKHLARHALDALAALARELKENRIDEGKVVHPRTWYKGKPWDPDTATF